MTRALPAKARRSPPRGPSPKGQLKTSVEIAPRRMLPLAVVIVAEVLVAIGLATAWQVNRPSWQGALAGAIVAVCVLAPVRGSSAPQWAAIRWGFVRDRRRRRRRRALVDPFDVTVADGSQIGFRWDGRTLLSLVQIDANPRAMTILEPGMTVSGDVVPVQALVDLLRQFDITVDSIDVISQGARSFGHTDVAAVYDAVLGPLPAIAQRNVCVAVRFDPSRCADAVRRRGGGRDGLLRTAATATRRVANRLTQEGLRPRILTASGIARTTNQLADGINVATVEERWEECREGRFGLCSFAVQPDMLTTTGLGRLWTVPSYSTTVCLSVRNDDDPDLVKVRGLVRFDGLGGTDAPVPGLTRLPGLQYSALAASLPIPAPSRPVDRWFHGRRDAGLHDVAVPASGCGQVIGADDRGRAVALPLFGTQVNRVEVCGTLHLAQQAVLRSLALGARVLVHTRRPALWRAMVEAVGRPEALWVTDFNRGAIHAGADRNYSVEVFDHVTEHPVRVGVTSIVVTGSRSGVTPAADVALEQISANGDTVRVITQAGSTVVTMVATDEEMRYLHASAGVA